MTNEALQSKVITALRLPLIVCVVLIHVSLMDLAHAREAYPLFFCVNYLTVEVIARTAVPLFFFISGFLFFYKTESFSLSIYKQKLRKRFRTLAIPYVSWNAIVILLYIVLQTFLPGLTSGENKPMADFSALDYLAAFWDMKMVDADWSSYHMPINYPLWFIRDLMVVVLFSPLVYWLVKRLRGYALAGLAFLWMMAWGMPVTGFSTTAFFFFAFGAYFSVNKKLFVRITPPPPFARNCYCVCGRGFD